MLIYVHIHTYMYDIDIIEEVWKSTNRVSTKEVEKDEKINRETKRQKTNL